MDSVKADQLGRLLGLDVVESPYMAPDEILLLPGRQMMVRDTWGSLRLPLMLGDMRRKAREHLDGLVKAAEQRLGLEPCRHSRVSPVQHVAALCGYERRCLVCGVRVGFLSDEFLNSGRLNPRDSFRSLLAMGVVKPPTPDFTWDEPQHNVLADFWRARDLVWSLPFDPKSVARITGVS